MTDKTDSKEREAFNAYLKDCDENAIVPDVGGAWHAAFQAGRASLVASAGSEPVAHLWQHGETGRTRVVLPDMIVDADASWRLVGPLFLGSHPSPPEGAGWRDIATAPKDGTLIVLGARNGVWLGKYVPVYQSGFRPENPWSSMLLNHDHMAERYTRPTHWMPLPKAPAPPASEAKGA